MKIQTAIVAALSLLAGSASARMKYRYSKTFQLKAPDGSCVSTAGVNDPYKAPKGGYSGLITANGRACDFITFGLGPKTTDSYTYGLVMSAIPYSTGDKDAAYTSYLCGTDTSERFDILRLGISTPIGWLPNGKCLPLTFMISGTDIQVKRDGDTEWWCLYSAGATGSIFSMRCSYGGQKLKVSEKTNPIVIEAGSNYDKYVSNSLDHYYVNINVG